MSSEPSLDNFPTTHSKSPEGKTAMGNVIPLAYTFNLHSGTCLEHKLPWTEGCSTQLLARWKAFSAIGACACDAAGAQTCPAEGQWFQNAEVAASCWQKIRALQEFPGRSPNSSSLKFSLLDASTYRKKDGNTLTKKLSPSTHSADH